MNLKNLELREYLVIIFIILGLGAFIMEDKFQPKIFVTTSSAEGYNGDVILEVKAYKKKNGELRITKINFSHEDSEEVATPALNKLVESVLNTQNLHLDAVAGATYTSESFIEAFNQAVKNIENM